MKKIWIIMFAILLVGTVSAATWDDWKFYNKETQTYTISNFFGLGKRIGELELKTPLDKKVGIGYQKFAEIELRNGKFNYTEIIKGIELYYIGHDMKEFERDVDYKIKTYEEVPAYITECKPDIKNGTICSQVQKGTEIKEVWKEWDNSMLKEETIILGLFTNVKKGDYVEWVIDVYGDERLVKWATWKATMDVDNTAYFRFERAAGAVEDSTGRGHNATNVGATRGVAGKVDLAFDFERADVDYVNSSNPTLRGLMNTGSMAVNLWFKPESYPLLQVLTKQGSTKAWTIEIVNGGQFEFCTIGGGGGWMCATTPQNSTVGQWYMITGIYNGTHSILYVNDTLKDYSLSTGFGGNLDKDLIIGANHNGANNADGLIDECGLWNSTLNTTERSDLWNGGAGLTYKNLISPVPTVILNSPPNNLSTLNTTIFFSANISGVGLINSSLFVDGVINQTNSSGLFSGLDYFFNTKVSIGSHNWTYEACNAFGCTIATARNLSRVKFIENSQTFNSITTEGINEDFELDINIGTGLSVTSARLNYSGDSYVGSVDSSSSPQIIITRTLTVPVVTSNVNATFWWNMTFSDTTIQNSTRNNQTINNLNIDNCSINNVTILNLTLKDEETQVKVNASIENTLIEVELQILNLQTGAEIENFSSSYNNTNPAPVCININLTSSPYLLTSTIKYESPENRSIEYYNIQNASLSNTTIPQNIDLLDLSLADTTEFQITFKDSNFVTIENALIQINRQYVSEGTFKTVEIPRTDSNGQTVAHLVEKDIVYNIIVIKDGAILGTFNNIIAFCEDALIGSCFISLNSLLGQEEGFDYDSEIGLFYDFDYNETTRNLQFDFSTTDGTVKNVSLFGLKLDMLGNTSVCNAFLVSSSGSLLCSVPASIGNETIIVDILVNGDLKLTNYVSAGTEFDIGDVGYFLMFFLVLSLALMMSPSKVGIIIGVLLGVISSMLLSLVKGDVIGIGSSIVWLTISAIILLWKLNSERST